MVAAALNTYGERSTGPYFPTPGTSRSSTTRTEEPFLLVSDAVGALAAHGLDPAVGFLHRDRPGREGLALDLMEEFRAPYADRFALALVNRQQIRPEHFRTLETGAVLLTDDGRKEVLTSWQKRKQEEIDHAFLGEKIPIGLLLHAQALLLARHFRADLDAYPPFEWR